MILELTKNFYAQNVQWLNTFLDNVNFLDINEKYPNSVVIRFGESKFVGEISIWNFESRSYLELEYLNLAKPNSEMSVIIKDIYSDNILEELKFHFNLLKLASSI